MPIENALWPTPDQFEAVANSPRQGPVTMINLLKFKPEAEYEDGRAGNLTGEEAYALYAEELGPLVAQYGAKVVFDGAVDGLVIGEGEGGWHRALIVEYPSREAFGAMTSSDAYLAVAVHRKAGLEGQLLIATTPARI